jgi:hypothetical protein
VRILSGLMALGYEIGPIMRRTSLVLCSDDVTVKFDDVEGLGHFFQVQGKDREKVAGVACQLGLDGTYVSRSYIEQVRWRWRVRRSSLLVCPYCCTCERACATAVQDGMCCSSFGTLRVRHTLHSASCCCWPL